jgi:hypothetical protein
LGVCMQLAPMELVSLQICDLLLFMLFDWHSVLGFLSLWWGIWSFFYFSLGFSLSCLLQQLKGLFRSDFFHFSV